MDISLTPIGTETMSAFTYGTSAYENSSFQSTLDNMIENGDDEGLREACLGFESYFLNMMMKTMRSTVSYSEGLFEKSDAEEMFQEMLDEELMNNVASTGGFGLADMMYNQLTANSSMSSSTDFSV